MHKIYKTHKGKIFNPEKISDDCWIDINSPTEDEIFNIKSKINIPEEFLASIRDIDEVPKFEKEDNLNFILIQTPVMHEENGKDDEGRKHRLVKIGQLEKIRREKDLRLAVILLKDKPNMLSFLQIKKQKAQAKQK